MKTLMTAVFVLAIIGVIAGVAWVLIADRKSEGGGAGVKLSDRLFKKKDKH